MKHPFYLWLALWLGLLAQVSHATHLKGGSLTWKRDTAVSGFTVEATAIISYDLSAESFVTPVNPPTVDKVKGLPLYQPGNIVTASCNLEWGDGQSTFLDTFEVVAVDFAAQILTMKAIEPSQIRHPYTTSGTFHAQLVTSDRDGGEELVNRQDSEMRIRSTVPVNLVSPSPNRPPAFDQATGNLVIIPKGVTGAQIVSFQAPIALDPDLATNPNETVKYRFIATEGEASNLSGAPWESSSGLTISPTGLISWNTFGIEQTIKTYCIQVVAEDFATPTSTTAKSRTTIEFQVWIDDTQQTGVPEIVVLPATPVIYAYPGQKAEFRIIGSDHADNSRLTVVYDPLELPAGAVLVPTAGFAGASHEDEDPRVTSTFSWTPNSGDLNSSHTMHFKFRDEDDMESDVVTVTVQVVNEPPALEPLVLNVTPEEHITVPSGGVVSFTVTGTCATAGLPLALYPEGELPEGATMDDPLPVTGTGSVQSTFTWTAPPGLVTDPFEPIEVKFTLGDAHRRETTVSVYISLVPALPSISLLPGAPPSFAAPLWQNLTFDFNVAGGFGTNGTLTVESELGNLDNIIVTSPHVSTLTWPVLPGQIRNGVLRLRVYDEWGQSAVLEVLVNVGPASAPDWWATYNVLTGGTAEDYGMANQGQLKAIATAAYQAMEAEYPDLATGTFEGINLAAYVASFSPTQGNYSPVVQGQVKNAASLFYAAIGAVTGNGNIGVPWTGDWDDDRHGAPTSVGQIKTIFSFPTPLRRMFNSSPTVNITHPWDGLTFTAGMTIPVIADAADPDGSITSVAFYEGTTLLGTVTSPPYQTNWLNTTPGTYTLTAVATDDDGVERTSTPVGVTLDVNDLPVTSNVSPSPVQSKYPEGSTITINATASDNHGVQSVSFYHGTTLLGTDTTAPFSFAWTNVPAGTHSLTAQATDNLGATGSFAPATIITVVTPTTVTLRNTTGGYSGMVDTYIRSDSVNATAGSATTLVIDRVPDTSALLKWDLSSIPSTATVLAVSMTFNVESPSSKENEVYAAARAWNPATATWNTSGVSAWGTAGAKATTDYEVTIFGRLLGSTTGLKVVPFEYAGTSKVQAWISGTAPNLGFIVRDYSGTTNTAALIVTSANNTVNEALRPALTVTYY